MDSHQELVEIIDQGIDKLEQKHQKKFSELESNFKNLSDAFTDLAQKGVVAKIPAVQGGNVSRVVTQIATSNEGQNLSKGLIKNNGFEVKANDLIPDLFVKNTVVNSDDVMAPQQRLDIVTGVQRRRFLRGIIPTQVATSNTVEYTREVSFTNNAGPQYDGSSPAITEGAQKPESDFQFELAKHDIITIAHFTRASRQVISDAPLLQEVLSSRLMYGLAVQLDHQIINGDGTNGNMSGLLKPGNFTEALLSTGDTQIDAIRRSVAQLQSAEFEADSIILNPADWRDIELLKTLEGEYITGEPRGVNPPSLWNIPVFVTNAIAQGTYLVCAIAQAVQLFMREDANVMVSAFDGDNFTKNLVTILCEMRAAVGVLRPAGIIKGTF